MRIAQVVRWVRSRVVLTPKEKQAICFILGAFLLGLATMGYRSKYPREVQAPPQVERRPAPRFERVSPPPAPREEATEEGD